MRLLPRLTRSKREYGTCFIKDFDLSNLTPSPTIFDVPESLMERFSPAADFSVALPALPVQPPKRPPSPAEAATPPSGKRQRKKFFRSNRPEKKKLFINRSHPEACESLITRSIPHQLPGYQGLASSSLLAQSAFKTFPELSGSPKQRLQALRTAGYRFIKTPRGYDIPLMDARGVVWGLVIGSPDDWESRSLAVLDSLIHLKKSTTSHIRSRRGDFVTLVSGYSYGNGQTAPTSFRTTESNRQLIDDCIGGAPIKNLLQYIRGPFRTWFPKVFDRYQTANDDLLARNPNLWSPTSVLPFSAMTLNLGERTVCCKHRDSSNVATGLCLVCAIGRFDHTAGGHLVLHEPRLVIELAPGTAILFPSALITHENIPIDDEEQRFSITGYTSGSLFRWIDQGYQTLSGTAQEEDKGKRKAEGDARWEFGWDRFPTAEELGLEFSAEA